MIMKYLKYLFIILMASLCSCSKNQFSIVPSEEIAINLLEPVLHQSDQKSHLTAPDGSVASSVATRISNKSIKGGFRTVEETFFYYPDGKKKRKVTTTIVTTEYKGFKQVPKLTYLLPYIKKEPLRYYSKLFDPTESE